MRTENKRRVIAFCRDYPEAVFNGDKWVNHLNGKVGPKRDLIREAIGEGWLEFDPIGRGFIVERVDPIVYSHTVAARDVSHSLVVFSVPSDKVDMIRDLMTRTLGYAEYRHHE